MGIEPPTGSGPAETARPEMGDAPPFSTWGRIYLVVLAALAVQVVVYAALTWAFR